MEDDEDGYQQEKLQLMDSIAILWPLWEKYETRPRRCRKNSKSGQRGPRCDKIVSRGESDWGDSSKKSAQFTALSTLIVIQFYVVPKWPVKKVVGLHDDSFYENPPSPLKSFELLDCCFHYREDILESSSKLYTRSIFDVNDKYSGQSNRAAMDMQRTKQQSSDSHSHQSVRQWMGVIMMRRQHCACGRC